jgi:hypothetical protein
MKKQLQLSGIVMVFGDFMVPMLLSPKVACPQSPSGLWGRSSPCRQTRVNNDPSPRS